MFFILDDSMFDLDDENPPLSWTPPQESSLEDTQVRSDAEQVPGFTVLIFVWGRLVSSVHLLNQLIVFIIQA